MSQAKRMFERYSKLREEITRQRVIRDAADAHIKEIKPEYDQLHRATRRLLAAKYFKLVDTRKAERLNWHATRNNKGEKVIKPCSFWATWELHDDYGNIVAVYSGPARTIRDRYPVWAKYRSLGFIFSWVGKDFTEPPEILEQSIKHANDCVFEGHEGRELIDFM